MKKALSLFLTLALLAGTFCTVVPMTASASAVSFTVTAGTVDAAFTGGVAEQPPAEYPFGDVNRDRVVDAFDYQMLKAYVLGTYTAQHEEDVALMDILSDGSIDAFDYQIVKAIVLGTYKVD